MFTPTTVPPAPLPRPRLKELRAGLFLLPPLSRKGTGPGLIVACPETADPLAIVDGVPWPLVKWAEESYTVVHLQPKALVDGAYKAVQDALVALTDCEECTPKGKAGIVGAYFDMPYSLHVLNYLLTISSVWSLVVERLGRSPPSQRDRRRCCLCRRL